MAAIYRGTTPTFKLTPRGYDVGALGDPSLVISQDMVFISLTDQIVVDEAENCVKAKLPVEDSLRLVPGLPASIQLLFDDGESSVAFAVHEFDVLETLVENVLPQEDGEIEPEEEDEGE